MFEDPDRGALTTTITTTMMTGTGSITDLEGAFTNADPEAVLGKVLPQIFVVYLSAVFTKANFV